MKDRTEMRRTRDQRGRPARPAVPGGKALARLNYFLQQRLLEDGDVPGVTSAMGRTRPTARSSRARSGRPVDTGSASRLEAFQERTAMATMAAPTPVHGGWRPLGPFCIPHGQTYGQGPGSRPAVSGRVASVAVDPTDDQHILIGAAAGGVWKTRDGGKTWQPRTDDQPSLAIGAVVFDPSNPSLVYAGTGEGDSTFLDTPNLLGVGLLRSQDGGTTWALLASDPFEQAGFYDLVVDPLNGTHLLAATTIGLFESTDGGSNWTQRRNQRTWDLSMRPAVAGDTNSTREVFAACMDGLFRSTNGGTTWTSVALPGAPSSFERIEVCHAPSDGNVVYVVAAGPPEIPDPTFPAQLMPTPYLWRRSLFGGMFSSFQGPADLQTGQAWYDWCAAVAPNNPSVLYIGGINLHRGQRSTTGNWTWTNLSGKSSGHSIHPDQHAIAFSASDPDVLFSGNDGGIYRSPDRGGVWEALNKGLCITELEFLAQHPQFEAWLIAGTQDNGTMRYQGEEVWSHVSDGDGGDCGVNAASPYTCYHTRFGMGMLRSTRGGGWASWRSIGPNVPDSEDYPNGALFYPPVEVNGNVVVQAGRSVWINAGTGTQWRQIPLPSQAGVATVLAIPTATRIYVGTTRGRVYRLEFSAGAWQAPAQLTRPVAGWISDLLVDPTNANRLWVTYSSLQNPQGRSRVLRSDDAGANWVSVGGSLPNIPINAIEIDPQHPDTVFVAADVGVYRSVNAGASWTSYNNQLPNCLIKDLLFHPTSRLLRAGTQARGVWEIAVDEATMPDVEVYLRDSAVDTGRVSPSPSGVDDPFTFGSQTFWWQCADIKVDAPSFRTPAIADVDFELFEDDQTMLEGGHNFAAGLLHENPQRNRTARVYVQVHNRGQNPATNVAVKVFFTPAALALPDLPASFWTNFPNNVLPANSPWQAIAGAAVIPTIEGGAAQIVGFAWAVPASAPAAISLLAVISADNDSIDTTELVVASLVQNSKKCGLKNLTVVNPPPSGGPPLRAVHLNLRGSTRGGKSALGPGRPAGAMIRGIVLSRRLSRLAKRAGLEQVALDEEERAELARLFLETPSLRSELDAQSAYRSTHGGAWLKSLTLDPEKPEPIVVLVAANPRAGTCSLVQWDENDTVVGGWTLQVEPQ
jgi:photosystem II stability/assembly factor-like uncharacterized protein